MHLGRDAAVLDAVPAGSMLNPADPSVDIKVTNRTGRPGQLRAWLNGQAAQAEVPAHSAIVKLAFPAMTEGRATLKLTITAQGVEDTETHEVLLLSPRHGYGNTSQTPTPGASSSTVTQPPSWTPSTTPSWTPSKTPGTTPSNTPSKTPSTTPSKTPGTTPSKTPSTTPSKTPGTTPSASPSRTGWPGWSKSPGPRPSWSRSPGTRPSWSATPTPYPTHPELPKTGESVGSYVLLGAGMLVFGLFVLGLAWALGRRTVTGSARER